MSTSVLAQLGAGTKYYLNPVPISTLLYMLCLWEELFAFIMHFVFTTLDNVTSVIWITFSKAQSLYCKN